MRAGQSTGEVKIFHGGRGTGKREGRVARRQRGWFPESLTSVTITGLQSRYVFMYIVYTHMYIIYGVSSRVLQNRVKQNRVSRKQNNDCGVVPL